VALVAAVAVVFGTVFVINSLRATPPPTPPSRPCPTRRGGPPPAPRRCCRACRSPAGTPIPIGATPQFAAVSPNGRLVYVANGAAKLVTVMDTSSTG